MPNTATRFRRLIAMVAAAENHYQRMHNSTDGRSRDIAIAAYSRALEDIFDELRLMRQTGALATLEALLETRNDRR
ncbi:hypothetical protein JT55_03595 [Rhodovulum sp. NI22]|jgi:hypothetical protein|uniref:hypothetical protein n=1 Tax=Actibacterium sp. TaxID=1872125 RepID=UPI00050DBF42|nr:hypothetical protein [Actibacterium sp.]KGB83175.1 hypothetical protein JT55_03595 [Rhodovulum sp. NI22]|tara:strand:- start:1750 stop:1977 length:228 start_codon:yes stop_codon:yes gene_type:complete